MEDHIELSDFQIQLLKYIGAGKNTDTMMIKSEFLPMGNSEHEIDSTLYFFEKKHFIREDSRGKYHLDLPGRGILNQIIWKASEASKEEARKAKKEGLRFWLMFAVAVAAALSSFFAIYQTASNNSLQKENQVLKIKVDSLINAGNTTPRDSTVNEKIDSATEKSVN